MRSIIPTKYLLLKYISSLCILLFLFSCKKNVDSNVGDPGSPPDLVTTVSSSVSGFVTDQNNTAVVGAVVKAGTANTITDRYGYFEIKNVQVVKEAATVEVNYTGYFKAIKTYMATEGKAAFFRIKLLQKTIAGIVDAGTGGNVSLSNGSTISLAPSSIKNATTGVAYNGAINVAVQFIDPTSNELSSIMPGDLRGINTDGNIKGLTSFGMMAVELTGASGELLQVADGKKATITFPVPASLNSAAPATIPLWHFNETNGLWIEEGTATKTGNTYVGEVSHFSFWNCDLPADYVQFNCTIHDQSGNPVPYVLVKISQVGGGPDYSRTGLTDATGYVAGAVLDNSQLLLEVYTDFNCYAPVLSQTFTTNNIDVSLGIITVNTSQGVATLNGTVTNCNNMPVSNGYVLMSTINNLYYRIPLNNVGSYSFSTILCGNSGTTTLIAEDLTTLQQSTPATFALTTGTNAIGNLQACGISIQQFIRYTIDGGAPIEFIYPIDSLIHANVSSPSGFTGITGTRLPNALGDHVGIRFPTLGIAAGSTQLLEFFSASLNFGSPVSLVPPIDVNITEYGNIGEYIAGNFTGQVVTNQLPVNTTHNIVCSFRVRRSF